MRILIATLSILLLLSACGETGKRLKHSRLNPMTWFGHGVETRGQAAATGGATTNGAAAQNGADADLLAATGEAATADSEVLTDPGDLRPLVAEVTALEVTKIPGGAIIRATGLPPTQGYWDAGLSPAKLANQRDDTLVFALRAYPPASRQNVSSPSSRELIVALHVKDKDLEGMKRIVVVGQTNRQTSER